MKFNDYSYFELKFMKEIFKNYMLFRRNYQALKTILINFCEF